MISEMADLKSSVASFAASCANKLRAQSCVCKTITVFVSSNRFREDLQQYGNAATSTLLTASSDTQTITSATSVRIVRSNSTSS